MTAMDAPIKGRRFTLSPCHLVAAIALCAVGCHPPGKPSEEHRPLFPQEVASFNKLFDVNCRGCHGQGGKGGPAPPLNDDLFRAGISGEEIRKVLTVGRPGTSMPAFLKERGGTLTAAQIEILVNQIKGIPYTVIRQGRGSTGTLQVLQNPLSKEKLVWGVPKGSDDAPPYHPPVNEQGDAQRGATVFARTCVYCHGADGEGGAKAGAINNQAFLGLTSDQALRRIIITGRNDLGKDNVMPSYADHGKPLTSQEIADLVALLASWKKQ